MSWLMSMIYDPFMKGSEEACLREWRGALLAGLSGEVLEIGAGTGANLSHYPAGLERLVLTEPDRFMRAKLEERARQDRGRKVELVAAGSDALPFADGAFDVVVSTLVLCSVADQGRTLRELRRVLRPGGKLVYLEHVAAEEDPSRQKWQRLIEPAWKRLAGNCHLTRRTGQAIRGAGFVVESEEQDSMRKSNPLVRASIRGVARKD